MTGKVRNVILLSGLLMVAAEGRCCPKLSLVVDDKRPFKDVALSCKNASQQEIADYCRAAGGVPQTDPQRVAGQCTFRDDAGTTVYDYSDADGNKDGDIDGPGEWDCHGPKCPILPLNSLAACEDNGGVAGGDNPYYCAFPEEDFAVVAYDLDEDGSISLLDPVWCEGIDEQGNPNGQEQECP
jgi:hypothetical protein